MFVAIAAMFLLLGTILANQAEDSKDIEVRNDQGIQTPNSNITNWHHFFSVANAMGSAAMAPTYLPPTLGALPTTSTVSINVSPTKIPMNLLPNAASSPMTIPAPTTATYSPTAQSLMDLALPALVVSLSLL